LVALSIAAVLALGALLAVGFRRSNRTRRATEQLAEAIAQDLETHGNGK
jgi:Flp pilus assembly protein TadB